MRESPAPLSSVSHESWLTLVPVRVLVVEDEVKMAALVRRGLEREGYAVDVAADGPEALWSARERGLRRHRARRHDPRARWLRGVPDAARRGALGAGADPDRPRLDRGPRAGPRRRRRRLPHQALRLRGAVRPSPGADPARSGRASDRAARSATSPSIRSPGRCAAATSRSTLSAKEFAPARVPDAPSRRGAHPHAHHRARLGLRLRGRLERRRRLRAVPAREGRPALRSRRHRDGPGGRLPPPGSTRCAGDGVGGHLWCRRRAASRVGDAAG